MMDIQDKLVFGASASFVAVFFGMIISGILGFEQASKAMALASFLVPAACALVIPPVLFFVDVVKGGK